MSTATTGQFVGLTASRWLTSVAQDHPDGGIRQLAHLVADMVRRYKLRAEIAERRLRTIDENLGLLCHCPLEGGVRQPIKACPLHGDGRTFVQEVRGLRELKHRAQETTHHANGAVRMAAAGIVNGIRE